MSESEVLERYAQEIAHALSPGGYYAPEWAIERAKRAEEILARYRDEVLEEAAALLEQPVFVFAFEAEDIRADVIRRVRALKATR